MWTCNASIPETTDFTERYGYGGVEWSRTALVAFWIGPWLESKRAEGVANPRAWSPSCVAINTSDDTPVHDPLLRELVRTTGYLTPLHAYLWFLASSFGFLALMLALSSNARPPIVVIAVVVGVGAVLFSIVAFLRCLRNQRTKDFLLTRLKLVPETPVQPIHWFARMAPLLLSVSAAMIYFGE